MERTHSWLNDVGRVRRCPERREIVVDLYVFPAASIIVIQQSPQVAAQTYRWPTRSATFRLR